MPASYVLRRLLLGVLVLGLLGGFIPLRATSQELVTFNDLVEYHEATVEQKRIEAEQALSAELVRKAESLVGKRGGQCVVFVKQFLGVTGSWGWARNVKPNRSAPEVGAVMITNQSKWGHVQVVLTPIDEHGGVWIVDSNYRFDGRIRMRYVIINKVKVIGFKVI